jgi:hypothetical protein
MKAKTSYYGFIVVLDDDGFYRVRNVNVDSSRPIPQELSRIYQDEDTAIYSIYRYFGEGR